MYFTTHFTAAAAEKRAIESNKRGVQPSGGKLSKQLENAKKQKPESNTPLLRGSGGGLKWRMDV